MHIGDWLGRRALLTPERVALREPSGAALTYQQWNQEANRTAHLLRRLGVRKGQRVAVLMGNCAAYLDLWFALGKLGGVLQALNVRLTPGELAQLLRRAPPEVLCFSPDLADKAAALRQLLPELEDLVLLPLEGLLTGRREESAAAPPEVELGWDDPWVLCYTGGTTGLPKAAVLTHRSITANAVNTVVSWGLRADDVALLDAPLFHTGGLNVFTAPLVYLGGCSVVCPRFDVEQAFDLLDRMGVTLYFGVPTMFLMMQQNPRFGAADLSRLRLLITGGAPCPQPVFQRFWERGVRFRMGYGLTEAGPNNFWLPEPEHKPGSVGFPLMHVDARVVGLDLRERAAGEVGELVLRGPHLFGGYLGDEAATAAALRPLEGGAGPRWLFTGDLAYRDDDGAFYIVGRAKDMYISGGENVYPAEIEGALCGHPAVLEAAVLGVTDPLWGEVGCAVVVRRPDAAEALDEAAVVAYLRQRLAGYKVPRQVRFVEALPRTGAGKVDKRRLRDPDS